MFLIRRPRAGRADRMLDTASRYEPTYPTPRARRADLRRFHSASHSVILGKGDETYQRARRALRGWQEHIGSGIEVLPPQAPQEAGETVLLVMRLGPLCVAAPCRITAIHDGGIHDGGIHDDSGEGRPGRRMASFTYATLPGHPEQGEETFAVVAEEDGTVSFRVASRSRGASVIARLGGPVSRQLQARAARRYLRAMVRAAGG